jgi:hypothetical protein
MQSPMLSWNIYEITTAGTLTHGVKLRGRIRKFGISAGMNILTENASDQENCVRFAVLDTQDADVVTTFVQSLIADVTVNLVSESVYNPVLSKLKVNLDERYEI